MQDTALVGMRQPVRQAARHPDHPESAEWQEFFKSLKDQPADVKRSAEGPSWEKPNWPVTPRDELVSALDGNWAQVEKSVGTKLSAKAQAKGVELTTADVQRAHAAARVDAVLDLAHRPERAVEAEVVGHGVDDLLQRG